MKSIEKPIFTQNNMLQVVLTSLLADLFVKTTLGPKTKKALMHNFYKIQIMYMTCLLNNTLSS